MDDGVEGEPQTLKTAGGRVSQVLLTVKTSATAYGSLNNSVNGSDISSITSVDELDQGECLEGDSQEQKIKAVSVYSQSNGSADCFIPDSPVRLKISEMIRTPRSHVLNPNLYTIELQHGPFSWSIQRRHRHFLKMHTELVIAKATSQLPTTKRDKIKCKIPSFPRRPEIAVIGQKNLEKRKRSLEKYLRAVLNSAEIRNENEVQGFAEISVVSFLDDCGQKHKESIVTKKSGGQKVGICCQCTCSWNERWLCLKDSYILYMNPKTLVIRDLLLIDSKFTVKSGRKHSGYKDGLVISNDSRDLTVKCQSERDSREWITAVAKAMAGSGSDWIKEHHHDSFAPIRRESRVQWFVDGRGYMASVADAIARAEEEIFITDWWLSPELHLKRPVSDINSWRLTELLKERASNGVKVFVLIYKELEMTLSINSYHSKQVLHSLHESNVKVLRHPDHLPGSGTFLWAHHEKIVCIDQKVSFLGGVDLCYGRWDDHGHRLTDVTNKKILTKTESVIAGMSKLIVDVVGVVPQSSSEFSSKSSDASISEDGPGMFFVGKDFCNPYLKDFFELNKPEEDGIDRNSHPRMPWHDIAAVVYGAAARDVARHFIQRWNFTKNLKAKEDLAYPLLLPRSYCPLPEVLPFDPENTVIADCQILRSASRWSAGIEKEDSIHKAYIEAIKNSKHFIYIENQFFITSLKSEYVYNEIGDALVERITHAHLNEEHFQIIVVMPLLPCFPGEIGQPSGSAMLVVEHWNYRTICRGPESILELLKAKGVEDPSKYIRFYGLRKTEELQGKLVTEIIYVHSKLMIVDDRTVILGSANINDRSMLGSRDSEIAIILDDTEMIDAKMDGQPYKAGQFAHSLRVSLFREHLGLLSNLEHDVSDPISQEITGFWVSTARNNTETFEKVFGCLPSDEVKSFAELPSYNIIFICPGLYVERPNIFRPIVYRDKWQEKSRERISKSDQVKAKQLLSNLQGHLVEKPLHFLENQDMRPGTGTPESLVPASVFT